MAMGNMDQYSYYMSLAMNICKTIGACNSDVFLRCLTDYYLLPSTSTSEKLVYDTDYKDRALRQPYYDADRIYSLDRQGSPGSRLVTKTSYNSHRELQIVVNEFSNTITLMHKYSKDIRPESARLVMHHLLHLESVITELSAYSLFSPFLSNPEISDPSLNLAMGNRERFAKGFLALLWAL